MFKALGQVQCWWRNGHSSVVGGVPFEVVCVCGQRAAGHRQSRHQVLKCSSCRRPVFVLPLSPLPRIGAGSSGRATHPALRVSPLNSPRARSPWFWPVSAGVATFVLVLTGFGLFFSLGLSPPGKHPDAQLALNAPQDLSKHRAEGEKALAEKDFPRAAAGFVAAAAAAEHLATPLPPAEDRRLQQMRRQCQLLADWPHEPLSQILRRTKDLQPEEWRDVVSHKRGKAFVFDAEIRRDATGAYIVSKMRPESPLQLRLQLESVKLFQRLHLAEPHRYIFAARLASVVREGPDLYTVSLEPDSALLLTDEAVVAACGYTLPDAAVQEVTSRQARTE